MAFTEVNDMLVHVLAGLSIRKHDHLGHAHRRSERRHFSNVQFVDQRTS
jgi:hypothetical protein